MVIGQKYYFTIIRLDTQLLALVTSADARASCGAYFEDLVVLLHSHVVM
jgi:hypothetical protein